MIFFGSKSPPSSLWHLCLYGAGHIRTRWSSGDVFESVWRSASYQLSAQANTNVMVKSARFECMKKIPKISPSEVNDMLRCFYYLSSKEEIFSFFNDVINGHLDLILSWADRDKYELLATFSIWVNSNKFGELELTISSLLFEKLAKILLSIADPFLFARLANLLLTNQDGIDSRIKKYVFEPVLNEILAKFQNSMSIMTSKETDEAHSINAFYVFSACLLGQTISSYPEKIIYNAGQINDLRLVADKHFVALSAYEKATQYTFYKLFFNKMDNDLEGSLCNELKDISNNYTKSKAGRSPIDYLRSSYLLWEHSQALRCVDEESTKVLTNNIIRRLSQVSSSELRFTSKYDNDILCFCYAYLLACFDGNSELRSHVLSLAPVIKNNIKSVPRTDLYKLLNCKNVVKKQL